MKRSPLLILLAGVTPALAQISVTPDSAPASTSSATAKPVENVQSADTKPAASSATTTTSGTTSSATPAVHHRHKATAKPTATPAPSATPTATPAPKSKGGLFHWLFGSKKHTKASPSPSATPAPAASPAPGKHGAAAKASPSPTASPVPVISGKGSKAKPAVTVSPTPKPAATPKASPAPKPSATPKPEAKAKPVEAAPSPAVTDVTALPAAQEGKHKKGKGKNVPATAEGAAPVESATPVLFKNAGDKAQYKKIREQAKEDPKVKELLEDLNSKPEGSDAQKEAAHTFYRALFHKMRELDPSQSETIDAMERASIRRVDDGKAIAE